MAALLGRSVEELHGTVSAAEFTRWKLFSRVEPFGGDGADSRIAWLLLKILPALNVKSVEYKKCLPPWDFEEPEISLIPSLQGVQMLAAAAGK